MKDRRNQGMHLWMHYKSCFDVRGLWNTIPPSKKDLGYTKFVGSKGSPWNLDLNDSKKSHRKHRLVGEVAA